MKLTHEIVRGWSRHAGGVRRYHEWPTVQTQTNAEHSWNVMRIYHEIFEKEETSGFSGKLLVYLMYHDCGEIGVGDLPYPIKKNNPALKLEMERLEEASRIAQGIVLPELSAWETMVAKLCDMIEMFEFGLEEVRRGNSYGQPVCDVTKEHIVGIIHKATDPRLHHEDAQNVRIYLRRVTGEYWT